MWHTLLFLLNHIKQNNFSVALVRIKSKKTVAYNTEFGGSAIRYTVEHTRIIRVLLCIHIKTCYKQNKQSPDFLVRLGWLQMKALFHFDQHNGLVTTKGHNRYQHGWQSLPVAILFRDNRSG